MILKSFVYKGIVVGAAVSLIMASAVYADNSAAEQKTTVYIVGDSTACEYGNDESYALPRAGWGMYLNNFLSDRAKVVDLALSGRSSKSFTTEDNYQQLCDEIKSGDYLLIQFGHNDAKNSTEEDLQNRYTNPEGDVDTDGSFKKSLYDNYVKPAIDKRAYPVLISPVSRRKFDESGKVKDSHGLYDDAVRSLAAEMNIPFVDMTKITEDAYNQAGADGTKLLHALFADRTKGENGIDNTHFSHYGAMYIASLLAEALQNMEDCNLKDYVDKSTFGAYDNIYETRGNFVVGLLRLIGASDSAEDISFDENGFPAGAAKSGIAYGDENGSFSPQAYITNQDMYTFVGRALEYLKIFEPTENIYNINELSSYAQNYVYSLIEQGMTDDRMQPLDYAKKLDAAYVLNCIYAMTAADFAAQAQEQSLDELEKVE